ncbi:hypothetical protein C8R48DRAFT_777788 [Suillus tomentosus]|nr:hypothetical protein C8R48DRAFT_777788 [Suillus tomentosus]
MFTNLKLHQFHVVPSAYIRNSPSQSSFHDPAMSVLVVIGHVSAHFASLARKSITLFCLEHRHSCVRNNAVFTVYTIYREYELLIPDAPELMQTFIAAESDATCKRNASVFLAAYALHDA